MKPLLTIAAAALVTLTTGGPAHAQFYRPEYYRPQLRPQRSGAFEIADSWYRHFLGRPLDRAGVEYWVPTLEQRDPRWALAHLLGSDEYINRQGGTLEGLVLGLYRDILGETRPARRDVDFWAHRVRQLNGNRQEMIEEFVHRHNVDPLRMPGMRRDAGFPAYRDRYDPPVYRDRQDHRHEPPVYDPPPRPRRP